MQTCTKQAFWGRVLRFVQSRCKCNRKDARTLADLALQDAVEGEDAFVAELRDLIPPTQVSWE